MIDRISGEALGNRGFLYFPGPFFRSHHGITPAWFVVDENRLIRGFSVWEARDEERRVKRWRTVLEGGFVVLRVGKLVLCIGIQEVCFNMPVFVFCLSSGVILNYSFLARGGWKRK